jgi:NAD-dependent SIR2 family protein deacetylase
MIYADKKLKCCDCNEQFTFTAVEQQYYSGKGFDYQPQRCPACRSTLFERRREAGQRGRWVRRSS